MNFAPSHRNAAPRQLLGSSRKSSKETSFALGSSVDLPMDILDMAYGTVGKL